MTLLRALADTAVTVVNASIAALLAMAVAAAVVGAATDPPPTPMRQVDPPAAVGEPMPDVRPLLEDPISPDGAPVPFDYGPRKDQQP